MIYNMRKKQGHQVDVFHSRKSTIFNSEVNQEACNLSDASSDLAVRIIGIENHHLDGLSSTENKLIAEHQQDILINNIRVLVMYYKNMTNNKRKHTALFSMNNLMKKVNTQGGINSVHYFVTCQGLHVKKGLICE